MHCGTPTFGRGLPGVSQDNHQHWRAVSGLFAPFPHKPPRGRRGDGSVLRPLLSDSVTSVDLSPPEKTAMKTILIANPKGGAGKTTLTTNLAGYLATRGENVFLWDLDRQKSALHWLSARPAHLPAIQRLDSAREKPAKGVLVLDSPAGLHGERLADLVKRVEQVIVPIVPSSFDFAATRTFLDELLEEKAVRKGRAFVAIVGMRVDARTRAAERLDEFLTPIELPVLTHLRDTQNYVTAAFEGKSIFDMAPSTAARDVAQWQPILQWLKT
jgi:chromosome partitioning protein